MSKNTAKIKKSKSIYVKTCIESATISISIDNPSKTFSCSSKKIPRSSLSRNILRFFHSQLPENS